MSKHQLLTLATGVPRRSSRRAGSVVAGTLTARSSTATSTSVLYSTISHPGSLLSSSSREKIIPSSVALTPSSSPHCQSTSALRSSRRRHASSTTRFSFWSDTFFRRKSIGSSSISQKGEPSSSSRSNPAAEAVAELRHVVRRKDRRELRRAWDSVVRAEKMNPNTKFSTSPEDQHTSLHLDDVASFLKFLCSRLGAKKEDYQLVLKVLNDCENIFGDSVLHENKAAIYSEMVLGYKIRATAALKSPQTAFDDLLRPILEQSSIESSSTSTSASPASIPQPISEHLWLTLLSEYVAVGQMRAGFRLWKLHNGDGHFPESVFLTILRGLDTLPQVLLPAVDEVVAEFESRGGKTDQEAEVLLAEIYRRLLRIQDETRMVDRLKARMNACKSLTTSSWNYVIGFETRMQGAEAGGLLFEKMQAIEGVSPDQGTLRTILLGLNYSTSESSECGKNRVCDVVYNQIRDWEDRLDMRADSATWRSIFDKILGTHKSAQWRDPAVQALAWNLYEYVRVDEVEIDAALAEIIIRPFCYSSPPRTMQALTVYGDFLAAYDEAMDHGETIQYASDEDIKSIYTSLFRAISVKQQNGQVDKSIAPATKAIDLLQDMRERYFTLPLSSMVNEITSLMAVMPDHHDAFRVYSYTQALQPRAFTEQAYHKIITSFCKTQLPKSRFPPPTLLFEFIRDMRTSGCPPTARIFTTIIDSYTKFSRSNIRHEGRNLSTEEIDIASFEQSIQAIRRVHAYIKLDSFLDVDVPLLNALMDAYNQTGAWSECWEVWGELMTRYRFEPSPTEYQPSLSIVLDACGFSGDIKRGTSIWRWATTKSGMEISHNNWASYIEFLSRNKRAIEAMEELVELAKQPEMKDVVDARLLAIPLRMSREPNERQAKIKAMLQTQFPHEWPHLRHIVEPSSARGVSRTPPSFYSSDSPIMTGKRTFFSLADVSKLLPTQLAGGGSGGDAEDGVQKFHARKILPYSQEQLYNLVADVPSYSTFIPFCNSSTIISGPSQTTSLIGLSKPFEVSAELKVGFGGFNERFTSKVTGKPYELVLAEVEDSPLFNNLKTAWSFSSASSQSPHPSASVHTSPEPSFPTIPSIPTSGPTLLSIDLSFSFVSPLHRMASQAFLPKISDIMVEAFEKRCLEVYGKGTK